MGTDKKTVAIPMERLVQVVQLQLAEKGSASLAVTGNSMWPMLRHLEDRVLLAPATSFQKGDIILYQRENGRYVLHRIVKKEKDYCICSGDNQYEKEWVDNRWVLAVVTGFYKGDKKYSINAAGYRLYRWLWITLFPARKILLGVGRRLCKIRNKIIKK